MILLLQPSWVLGLPHLAVLKLYKNLSAQKCLFNWQNTPGTRVPAGWQSWCEGTVESGEGHGQSKHRNKCLQGQPPRYSSSVSLNASWLELPQLQTFKTKLLDFHGKLAQILNNKKPIHTYHKTIKQQPHYFCQNGAKHTIARQGQGLLGCDTSALGEQMSCRCQVTGLSFCTLPALTRLLPGAPVWSLNVTPMWIRGGSSAFMVSCLEGVSTDWTGYNFSQCVLVLF